MSHNRLTSPIRAVSSPLVFCSAACFSTLARYDPSIFHIKENWF